MYTGTMIEELIATVERVEAHARVEQQAAENHPPVVIDETIYVPFAYEPPAYMSVMGVA